MSAYIACWCTWELSAFSYRLSATTASWPTDGGERCACDEQAGAI